MTRSNTSFSGIHGRCRTGIEIICYLRSDIGKFQILDVFIRNRGHSLIRAEDISGNFTGGVAVTIVVNRCDESPFKIITVGEQAHNVGKSFFMAQIA